jgi:hypothetical protein
MPTTKNTCLVLLFTLYTILYVLGKTFQRRSIFVLSHKPFAKKIFWGRKLCPPMGMLIECARKGEDY